MKKLLMVPSQVQRKLQQRQTSCCGTEGKRVFSNVTNEEVLPQSYLVTDEGADGLFLRSYQIELLEKAKRKNIIVYLGTGSGKTFIAVMLIKHMRDQIAVNRKVVFLCNNVALLEQQAEVIKKTTGLRVGTYCGAHGVDDWDRDKWRQELDNHDVLVMIHQVLLDALSRYYVKIPDLSLIIIDECHHAVKNHAYSKIMREWYHKAKAEGDEVPKILGLSASIVVKSVNEDEFRQEKVKLEAVLDATVESCEELTLQSFVSYAQAHIIKYPKSSNDNLEVSRLIVEIVNHSRDLLIKIKVNAMGTIMKCIVNKNSQATALDSLKKDYRFFNNSILGSVDSLLELGLYPLFSMRECLIEELYSKSSRTDQTFYDNKVRVEMEEITRKCLEDVFRIVESVFYPLRSNDRQKLLKYSCSKLLKLFEILDVGGMERLRAEELRCIVFVERKLTARALQFLIWKMKLRSVKDVGFVHSTNAGKNVKDPRDREDCSAENRKMSETLQKFREGRINVLVSTSVVEEGIDVPSCNIVIKFDFPQSFRSFVQSKGRARKKCSHYVLLIEDGDTEKVKTYEEWVRVNDMSIKECHNNNYLPNPEDEVESHEEYFCTSVARLSGTQALGLLHHYLQKITVDRFTRLTPAWTIDNLGASNTSQLWRGLGLDQGVIQGFTATIQLPHKTPLHFPVTGGSKPRADLAKRSAALQVIRLLHEKGELTEDLKVKKKEKYSDDEEDEDAEEGRTGTRNYYQKCAPSMLTEVCDNELYLHSIEMELVQPAANPRYQLHYPETDNHCFGILTSSPLPLIGPLEIHSASGLVHTFVRCKWKPIRLTREEQRLAHVFHDFIFSHCLKLTNLLQQHKSTLPLIVPLDPRNLLVDWRMCKQIYQHCMKKSKDPDFGLKYNLSTLSRTFHFFHCFQDLVLYPRMKEGTGPQHYFIEEISPDLTASTVMDGLGSSMAEHARVHQGVHIKNKHQHLLRISSACKELYMFSPGGEPVADGKKRSYRSYRIGELMFVEPVTAGLWRQAQMMPWVLHRVSSLVSALPYVDISWTERQLTFSGVETVNNSSKEEMEARMMFLIRNVHMRDTDSSPAPGQVVQALTLASAGDNWNMERLEILGDCFLKYSTTIFLYYTMTDICDEGDLSSARSRIVGNRNLRLVAKQMNLANLGIISQTMDPAKSWIPPGYTSAVIEGDVDRVEDKIVALDNSMDTWQIGKFCKYLTVDDLNKLRQGSVSEADLADIVRSRVKSREQVGGVSLRGYHILSDKSQADCIEAMLGCYLYNCGMNHCLEFMARIGINLDSQTSLSKVFKRVQAKDQQAFTHFVPQQDAFVSQNAKNEHGRFQRMIEKLGVAEIENIIGYTFKEKSFLLEAFTHPSYEDNRLTHSYEKLEFLGDAVLDYLVTCYIYTHTNADPGQVTDTRSALVCNNMFASILTDFGLEKFILHSNPGIMGKINAYLDTKQDDVATNLKQFNEEDVPELELVEVPKVLGDVFEALIGAIFIDSGHDLEQVWEIYKRFCPNLPAIVSNPPLNMKKELLEKFPGPGMIKFSRAVVEADMVLVEVEVNRGQGKKVKRFRGRGKNKILATMAACKCALRDLK